MICLTDCTLPEALFEQIAGQGQAILPELIHNIINSAMPIERQQFLDEDGRSIDAACKYKEYRFSKTEEESRGINPTMEYGTYMLSEGCKACAERCKRSGLLLLLLVGAWFVLSACRGGGASDSSDTSGAPQRALQNKGSDTLVNVALAWAETYREVEPEVSIAVTGGGSGTGIAALINGTVDIANASRAMKDKEIEEAQANGIEPLEHVVAIDALAIITNLENPVSKLTIQQLSDMYTGRITNWKDVGGNDAPIILLSRETNSGTHVYFLEEVVRRGEKENKDIFAPQTLLMPSSVGITSEVRRNPNSIGYDGLGYVDPQHEKVISIAVDGESDYIPPSVESASEGIYPLSRNLFMYTAGEPTGALADYLAWILGEDGQGIVAKLGFVPLTDG